MLPPPAHSIPFTKYQGAGNDFILLDWSSNSLPSPDAVLSLCDRHFGIGADGLLLLAPASPSAPNPRMILFNADGSRPEMCGNGVRCAALHVLLTHPGAAPLEHVTIDTDAGPRVCEILEHTPTTAQVRVDMGVVSQPSELLLSDPQVRLQTLSVGNPHAVLLDHPLPGQVAALGPTLSTHPAFPDGTNVGFARVVSPSSIDLQVWERGAGLTLACGTGACAAVAAAWATRRIDRPNGIQVRLPGGLLTVDLDPATWRAWLSGPALRVFAGVVDWPG